MKCPNCGQDATGKFCDFCGAKMPQNTPPVFTQTVEQVASQQPSVIYVPVREESNVSPKSKTVALILTIFLGCLGVHYFYAGRIGMGILYLVTLGIFGFGWLFDIYRVATGKFVDRDKLPITKGR